jgi:hypothetical protein
VSSSQTLSDLKNAIAASNKLGNVPAGDQRVFYLGRELKTLNRTLTKVLGRQHGVNVIHFMAIHRNQQSGAKEQTQDGKASRVAAAQADDDDDDDIEVIDGPQNKAVVMIDLADDDDDSDVEEIAAPSNPKRRRRA